MKLKFPTAYTILAVVCILVAGATWLMPAGFYKYQEADGTIVSYDQKSDGSKPVPGSYETVESRPQGLGAIVLSPIKGFYDAKDIIIFILLLGGFINIALASGAITGAIKSVVSSLKGREQLMIPILLSLISFGGTIYGMSEETVGFYPVIVPVMLIAGYDTMTAAAIILIGSGVGTLASTINPFAAGVAAEAAGISIAEGLFMRSILFIVLTAISSVYVMRYAAKIKKDPTKSLVYATYAADRKKFLAEGDKATKTTKLTGAQKRVLTVFGLTFAVMIYGVIPFEDIGLGFIPSLGWWFDEMTALFMVAAILMGVVACMSEKEIIKNFMDGVADISSVTLIVGLARGVKVLMEEGAIGGTLLYWSEELVTGLSSYVFVAGVTFVEMVLTFFIPSSTALGAFSIPILAPIATFAGVETSVVNNAFMLAYGVMIMITPTYPVLMAGLSLARVPFNKWVIFILPLLAIILATSLGIMFVGITIA